MAGRLMQAAADAAYAAAAMPRRRGWGHLASNTALALLCGAMLGLATLHDSLYLLAWAGFVPLLLAIRRAGAWGAYGFGMLAGFALYAIAANWIVDFAVLLKGFSTAQALAAGVVFWLYAAQQIALIAVAYTWLRRASPVPEPVLIALIVTAVFAGFPMMFSGQVGETQSQFLPALQAIAFTGVYGLDFVIALVNGLIFVALTQRHRALPRRDTLTVVAACALVVAWFGYGVIATRAWDRALDDWQTQRIGIVQPNELPGLGRPYPPDGFGRAHPPEMALSEQLAGAAPDVIVWPESNYRGYFERDFVRNAYHRQAAAFGAPVLFQDIEPVHAAGRFSTYNTAAFVNGAGELTGTYRKIKRMAFGEYVPFGSIPLVHGWVRRLFGDFSTDLTPGTAPATFAAGRMTLVPLICYEVMFPLFVARALAEGGEGRVLATLSNNSWFGATRQPYQHVALSSLRAVEHRVPLVHVVNNGPSAIVAPNGRFLFRSSYYEGGAYAVDMPYSASAGGTFFTRFPYLFIGAVYALLLVVVVATGISMARHARRPPRSRKDGAVFHRQ